MIHRFVTEASGFGVGQIGANLAVGRCARLLGSKLRILIVLLGIGGAGVSTVAEASGKTFPEEGAAQSEAAPEVQADQPINSGSANGASADVAPDIYKARYTDSRAAIKNYSDQELTTLAGRWGLLSEPQRDALLAETRDRMLQQMAIARSGGRAGERLLSQRELGSLSVAPRDRAGGPILLELPVLASAPRQQRTLAQLAPSAGYSEPQLATQGTGQIRIERRRYGRRVVRGDGRVVQQVQTRVFQVTQGDPSRAFGRMGFERRRQQQSQLLDPGSPGAQSSHSQPGVFRVADPRTQ